MCGVGGGCGATESAFVVTQRVQDATAVAPESELRTLLQDHAVTDLFICGLATDFAVQVRAAQLRVARRGAVPL